MNHRQQLRVKKRKHIRQTSFPDTEAIMSTALYLCGGVNLKLRLLHGLFRFLAALGAQRCRPLHTGEDRLAPKKICR